MSVEFNTNPAAAQNVQEAKSGPYTIRLLALDPYPETPAAFPVSDYRAQLLVVKE